MKNRLLIADWLVPVATSPMREGAVVVEGDHIAWVGPAVDLPQAFRTLEKEHIRGILMPGLINAHTHLQYTNFVGLGKKQFRNFEHWAEEFEIEYDAVTDPADWSDAARKGVRLGLETGTTSFAEIITNDPARGALHSCCAGGIEYLEVIGELEGTWAAGGREQFLARLDQPQTVPAGISPHAPYSVDPEVIRDLVRIANERGLRVHTHLAESSAEDALYLQGVPTVLDVFGDLRDEYILVRQGGAGLKAAMLAHSIDLLSPQTHVAHGIYLDREGRDLLLQHGTRVALCPRSNAVIGLAEAPVADYLREGHEICVGTDSLASCPSLDLMADVRALAEIALRQGYAEPDLFTRLIRAATLHGAKALGLPQGYGTLVAGGPADISAFAVSVIGSDVERALVERAEGHCILTLRRGAIMFDGRSANLAPPDQLRAGSSMSSMGAYND